MSRRYRQLLSAPQSDSTPSSESYPSGTSSTFASRSEPLKRQRIGTQLACNACRRRKIRCDGQKPQCEACRRRGETQSCIYAQTRAQSQASKESEQALQLFELLKSGSESHALEIMRIIRSHGDLGTALSIAQAKRNPQRHASGGEWAPVSTRHLGLQFELMARNPVGFPPMSPFEFRIIKAALSTGRVSAGHGEHGSMAEPSPSSSSSDPNPFPPHNPYISSRFTLSLCDERLENLVISFWTTVPIADELAGRIISLYLETDHPLLGTFDPSLFLNDLVSCSLVHCSRLLVNAIMYWGCQMYSAYDPAIKPYIAQFSDEAEGRWTKEKPTDSLLRLAGTQLLGLAYLGDGKDHYVLTYVAEANAMGTRMGLFGIDPQVAAIKAREIAPELRNASSYAAWGAFNWIVLMSLFYQQPGLSYPTYPPVLPIPGHPWHNGRDESSESVREPLHSAYMGDTFPVLCRFWRIIHEVTLRYYRDQCHPRERWDDQAGLAFAEYKYRELIAWAETLPQSMVRSEHSPHHVLIFHIWFHVALLDILRPFTVLARSASKPMRLKTFPCKKGSPDVAYKVSVNQLKRLIVVYRKKYVSSTYTMLWHTALIRVTNALLGNTKDSAWRFYLSFCLECYRSLRHPYRFAEAIGQSLLSMALQSGDLSASEARHMMQQFEENRLNNPSDNIRATFMADLNLAMTDPKEASVENLSHKFEDIALFREFTNQQSSEDEAMESNEDVSWEDL
ncbi:Nitrogen assimilation transcription factor nit-4 [Fusarium albosuccineum]|uniref:Nitrogen assimilation transcription factor nit-4 n=1 Tax=Fusarium albosuccineum TaxID=1237068 RepID=A0A8H4L8V6_9HYPO|nr:Nitrogen assimilation transcription factor nit-4 [Fusarium albosuccineum]